MPILFSAIFVLLVISPNGALADKTVRLRMAATTSVENSGLMDYLLPSFEKECGCRVELLAVGTGKALRLGQQGDVDILMVHAPEKEEAFMKEGHGVNRRKVMVNNFILVGPTEDPANIHEAANVRQALQRIAKKRSAFVSRGDESGTHAKEQSLWAASNLSPTAANILEVGQGMSATLNIADQKRAYALTDKATYLAMGEKLTLAVLFEGDPLLVNPYSVISVNPAKHQHINAELAERFSQWIVSQPMQEKIGQFQKNGQPLFYPAQVIR